MVDLLIRGGSTGLFGEDSHVSTNLILTVRQTCEAVRALGILYSAPQTGYGERRGRTSGVAAAKRAKRKRKRAGK